MLFGFSGTNVFSVDTSTGAGTLVFDYGSQTLGQAFGASAAPAVIADPIPPGDNPIPPPPPAPGKKKHLVFITHGWNSTALDWPDVIANEIKAQIGQAQAVGDLDPNIQWTVISYDWSIRSGFGCFSLAGRAVPCVLPWTAYANAFDVGKDVGKQLSIVGYDHIHFIAHSAGSNLIQTAAEVVRDSVTNPLTIHTTFLDAYDPSETVSRYGAGSVWAEQYVDTRLVLSEPFDATDIVLPFAFNFDVTNLDPVPSDFSLSVLEESVRRHAWPYCWYDAPLRDPVTDQNCLRVPEVINNTNYGFHASLESGKPTLSSHTDPRFVRGHECDLNADPTCTQMFPKSSPVLEVKTGSNPPFDIWTSAADSFFISATGIIDLFTDGIIRLSTGSPAWISVRFDVPQPINMLRFGYQFPFSADGVLSVFFDGQLVFRADERHSGTGTIVTEPIPLGKVAPGLHSLSYRLDAFNNTQSSIEISEIRTGTMQLVRPQCTGKFATIVGTDGPDVLTGTPGADVINGLGGNDVINGGGGNDRICGDAGNDRIKGGSGRDRLNGGPGRDRVIGGKGNDKLDGGPGRDTLHGGSGTDKCIRGEKKIRCES